MNELYNIVNGNGNYDGVSISLTSNTSVVKLLDGLTLTLAANKSYWKDGNLKYTITLDNATDIDYENVILTDVLDTNYITFIDDSVEINNVTAQSSEFSYEESSHTLIINLAKVAAQSKTIVTFNVKKN